MTNVEQVLEDLNTELRNHPDAPDWSLRMAATWMPKLREAVKKDKENL